jgi:plastocyanin
VGIFQKPFAILVIFAGLVYAGLALFGVMLQYGFFDPSIAAFGAIFIAVGGLVLWGKRWSLVPAAVLGILFLALYLPVVVEILTNPGNSGFWLTITALPVLFLVTIFSILSLWKWKAGLAQTAYLASPRSAGGLFTLAIIGFIIGGLVIGGFSAGTIARLLGGGGQSADITIVDNAMAKGDHAYSPANFTVRLGVKVTWFNADTTTHTVTSLPGSGGPSTPRISCPGRTGITHSPRREPISTTVRFTPR